MKNQELSHGGNHGHGDLRSEATATNPRQESTEETLTRLAGLTPMEYDQLRKDEAHRLGCRVGILDEQVSRRRKQADTTQGQVNAWIASLTRKGE